MYKSHFYIDDEDAHIIVTNEKDTLFLLLVHLAVYIIINANEIII